MNQIDVVTAILHGRLEKKVHIKILPYMNIENPENKVLRIKGAIYGLKQRKERMKEIGERHLRSS